MKRQGQTQQALDSWRINLAESWEILFWTQQLGCTEDELRAAVEAVGAVAGDVRVHVFESRGRPDSGASRDLDNTL